MILLALAAAAMAAPQYPEAQMKRDAEILLGVSSETMTVPVLKCAQSKIMAHDPSPNELGDIKKAAQLADTTLAACGIRNAKVRLKQAVAAKNPGVSAGEAERLSEIAFGIPFVVALHEAAKKLNAMPPEPERKVIPIEIPCTPELERKADHPCYRAPKN